MVPPSLSLVSMLALEAGRNLLLSLPRFLLVGSLVSCAICCCPEFDRLDSFPLTCSLLKKESFCKFSDSVCLKVGFGEDVFSLIKSNACTLGILPREYFSSYTVGDKIFCYNIRFLAFRR